MLPHNIKCQLELSFMLIDAFLPGYQAHERHEIEVAAPSETVFAALRHMDFHASPVIRVLSRPGARDWRRRRACFVQMKEAGAVSAGTGYSSDLSVDGFAWKHYAV